MEPALWKSVFYRPIEEFRRRIKAASAAGEKGREPLQKVCCLTINNAASRGGTLCSPCTDCMLQVKIAFGRFLQDAALFYKQLAVKLQIAYGSVGYSVADAQLTAVPSVPDQAYQHQDCRTSVFRCLICLGDIFRYEVVLPCYVDAVVPLSPVGCPGNNLSCTWALQLDLAYVIMVCRYEISVLQHQPKKDWSVAARHYRLAMAVFPSGGRLHLHLSNSNPLPSMRIQPLPSADTANTSMGRLIQFGCHACVINLPPLHICCRCRKLVRKLSAYSQERSLIAGCSFHRWKCLQSAGGTGHL